MKKITISMAMLSIALLSGCASILNDKTQSVNISGSNGKEIQGAVDGQAFKGPGIVNVVRENKNKIVTVSTEGCAKETSLEKKVDNKFFINILSGGVFGSTTDYATEKMWGYSENIVITCK